MSLPVTSTTKDEPAHSIVVDPPSAIKPRSKGTRRDVDLSANHPKIGDPTASAAP
jgi:hypothetical protein